MVTVGELRRRLTLEAASDVADGRGGMVRTWATLDTVFAAVTPRRRREDVVNGREVGLVTHRITIRWRGDVTGDMRFADGDRLYRVLSVEDADPVRRFLDCWCEEEQP
ncbi:phage head closure protein [Acuticoccus sp. MNP-M23]|uniref:phage head closure protein n=1 Tax=Acuticoccus sp. MNP-M23 TaxID=3072793 RepID=UPI0028167A39|nr:phage head closure protein [Acuticoccus sp. MNP-M23]WMS41694.1 phage head closure protein [Acuticoccus sp. MNP-M23]